MAAQQYFQHLLFMNHIDFIVLQELFHGQLNPYTTRTHICQGNGSLHVLHYIRGPISCILACFYPVYTLFYISEISKLSINSVSLYPTFYYAYFDI